MFFPANEKAKELMSADDFGSPQLVALLDHVCHPVSLLVYLLGMPESLYYERSGTGAGLATFGYASGVIASIAFTKGASMNGGIERTLIVSDGGMHVTVENNTRVTLYRMPGLGYGDVPDFYCGRPEQASATWEPEFSLGQLYNKGLFLLGYYNEINEFAASVLEGRPPSKGTLEQAWQVTRIFEAFAEGAGRQIPLPPMPA